MYILSVYVLCQKQPLSMIFNWNEEKNLLLREQRGVGFEDVLLAIEEEKVMDVIPHPNQEKYPHQRIYIIDILGYIYYVPFVKNETEIFLKTIIPSRKYTKQFRKNNNT